jgi:hypothetical protein
MTVYHLDPELERALDRWIEALPGTGPRLSRQEALEMALRDFLVGVGVVPWDEESDEAPDSTFR